MNLVRSIISCFGLILLIQQGTCFQLSRFIYDDSYITNNLDDRYPYLKLSNDTDGQDYTSPRDYFNFKNVFEPSNEYLDSVNIEQHLFEELKAMEISSSIATTDQWHYSNNEERLKSGWPEADEYQCIKDLAYIDNELELAGGGNNSEYLFTKGHKNIQMLRYIDSWGRPPSETYYGHAYWVGSYRGCKLAELSTKESGVRRNNNHIKFRYCWAKVKAKDWPRDDVMVPPTSIRVGVCLPNTCDTLVATKHKQTVLKIMTFNFSPMHKHRFNQIIDIYCLPNQPGLSIGGKIFCMLLGLWLTLVISASLVVSRVVSQINSQNVSLFSRMLQCLTIQENFKRFVMDDDPPPPLAEAQVQNSGENKLTARVDLRSLGLLRLIASIAVCVAHCACSYGWVFNTSTFNIIEYRQKVTYQTLPSFMKSLDLYLVLSGLLGSYIIIGKFPNGKINSIVKPKVFLTLNLARYLRLAPTFVLVLAFMKSIYPHLSDGPMWDYGTYKYSMQGQCQRSSWWRILGLPIIFGFKGNSYFSECLSVSWYIITDMKIFFITPFFIYIMMNTRRSPKLLVLIVAVLVSTLCQYKDLSMQQLIYFRQIFQYGQLFAVSILNLTFGEPGYFSAINRFHAVAIGLFAGLHLQRYKNGQIIRWPFWMTGWFFWATILWEVYDFFTPLLAQSNYLLTGQMPSEETIKLVMVLKPRIDAFIFAIITLRCVSDLAQKLMQFSKPLYKLSKLSYCVFLTHTIIISYVVSAHEKSRPEAIPLQFMMFATFIIVISFIISFPLYILVESPTALLLNCLLGVGGKFTPPSRNVDDEKIVVCKNETTRQMRNNKVA